MNTTRPLPPVTPPVEATFIELPGLLILRLMSRCNNRCIFCMVDEEIHTSTDVPFEVAAAAIERQPVPTKIEFFGGEPTIYPRFLELLALARGRGQRCSVATHGRTFASDQFTARVAALGTDDIYIRTSLYGHEAELHDSYTLVPRSFEQTIRGARNIASAGFPCQVNIVIMARNVDRLLEMTRLVHACGVPRIKFSNLIDVGFCEREAVPLNVVSPRLTEAIDLAEFLGMRVTVEKTPVCVAGGRLDLISTERLVGAWNRAHDDAGACGQCLVRRWCDGLDPGYVTRFGHAGIRSIDALPPEAVRHALGDHIEPEFLKVHCVRLPDEATERSATEILALAEQVETHFGMLAVIPERFVRSVMAVGRNSEEGVHANCSHER